MTYPKSGEEAEKFNIVLIVVDMPKITIMTNDNLTENLTEMI